MLLGKIGIALFYSSSSEINDLFWISFWNFNLGYKKFGCNPFSLKYSNFSNCLFKDSNVKRGESTTLYAQRNLEEIKYTKPRVESPCKKLLSTLYTVL